MGEGVSQGRGELPVACTLGPTDGAERRRRWQRLHQMAAPTTQVADGQLQVQYRPGPGVREELQDLATAEQACCPFVDWKVVDHAAGPVLEVTAPAGSPDALEPIVALFLEADPAT